MTRPLTIIAVCLGVSLCACDMRLTPFRTSMVQTYSLGPKKLKAVQFYNSVSFSLRRSAASSARSVVRGQLVFRRGKKIEEIVIRRATPGIVVGVGPDNSHLDVTFERGSWLRFVKAEREMYVIEQDSKNIVLLRTSRGTFPYKVNWSLENASHQERLIVQGYRRRYSLRKSRGAPSPIEVHLMVSTNALSKQQRKSHVQKGVTID